MEMNGIDRCLGCMEDKRGAPSCPHCGWDERTPPTPPLCLSAGVVLADQYAIGRMLGRGGFGVTYLAWDIRLDTRVAIKEYLPRDCVTRSPDQASVIPLQVDAESAFGYGLRKFIDEARILARFVDHSGIVTVLGFFEANGTGYMVMQYADGVDLRTYLERLGGRLPVALALPITMHVLDALALLRPPTPVTLTTTPAPSPVAAVTPTMTTATPQVTPSVPSPQTQPVVPAFDRQMEQRRQQEEAQRLAAEQARQRLEAEQRERDRQQRLAEEKRQREAEAVTRLPWRCPST